MLDKVNLARPYARAVFEQARQSQSLESWSKMLSAATAIVQVPDFERILNNPLVKQDHIAEIILRAGVAQFSNEEQNFIRLLAKNNRIAVLPEIAELFEKQMAELETRFEVEITSAYPLASPQVQMLAQALEKRFGHKIDPIVHVDQNLIAGVIVRFGDIVIDGSLRAGLTQMANELRI